MQDSLIELGLFLLSPMLFTGTADHFDVTIGAGYSDTIVLEDRSLKTGIVGSLKFEGRYKYFDVAIEHASDLTRKDKGFGSNRLMVTKTWRIK